VAVAAWTQYVRGEKARLDARKSLRNGDFSGRAVTAADDENDDDANDDDDHGRSDALVGRLATRWAPTTAAQKVKLFDEYIRWTMEPSVHLDWRDHDAVTRWLVVKTMTYTGKLDGATSWGSAIIKCARLLGTRLTFDADALKGAIDTERRNRSQEGWTSPHLATAASRRVGISLEDARYSILWAASTGGPKRAEYAAAIATAFVGCLRVSDLVSLAPRGTALGTREGRPYVELVRIKTASRHDAQGFFLDMFPELHPSSWLGIARKQRESERTRRLLLMDPTTDDAWSKGGWTSFVKRMATECPVYAGRSDLITSHSFRIGAATELSLRRIPNEVIRTQLGWSAKSKVFKTYIRSAPVLGDLQMGGLEADRSSEDDESAGRHRHSVVTGNQQPKEVTPAPRQKRARNRSIRRSSTAEK